VDYEAILRQAETEGRVLLWDGGISLAEIARNLGVSTSAIANAIQKLEADQK
jgi:DNA-binding Lrp family transcriptional regulator